MSKKGVIPIDEPLRIPFDQAFKHHEIQLGRIYLIKEQKPNMSIELFTRIVKDRCNECNIPQAFACENIGCNQCTLECPCKSCSTTRFQGLCITTHLPYDIRGRYLLQTTPIFWISKQQTSFSLNPADLGIIAGTIIEFVKKSQKPIVLLEGVEYLITINNFRNVLKLIHEFRELIMLRNGIFILPINPLTLEQKELALLERNTEILCN